MTKALVLDQQKLFQTLSVREVYPFTSLLLDMSDNCNGNIGNL